VNVPFAPSGIWRIQSSSICGAVDALDNDGLRLVHADSFARGDFPLGNLRRARQAMMALAPLDARQRETLVGLLSELA
jgi:hypothetical protein